MSSIDATQLHGPEHVKVYRETDGEVGHDWRNGSPALILTTRAASPGGAPERADLRDGRRQPDDRRVQGRHPAAPRAGTSTCATTRRSRCRSAATSSRPARATPPLRSAPELWKQMTEIWPDYDNYQQRTDREIPIVILERTNLRGASASRARG